MQPKCMSFEEFCDYAYNLRRIGVGVISFTGGEPMMWSHLSEAIRFTRTKKMIPHLNTNGTLLSQNALRSFAEEGLAGMMVSLDSIEAIPSSYKTLSHNPELLNLIHYAKSLGIITTCNAVLSKATAEGMPSLIERLDSEGIPISIGIFDAGTSIEAKRALGFNSETDLQLLANTVKSITSLKAQGAKIVEPTSYFLDYLDSQVSSSSWICQKAKLKSLAIGPSGQVLLCPRINTEIGFLNSSFKITSDMQKLAESRVAKCSPFCHSNCSYNSSYYQRHPFKTILGLASIKAI